MKIKKSTPNMVNVLIRDKFNRALLINNIKHRTNRFEFPGGKVENGDKLEQRAYIEVLEELGIEIKLIKINGTKIFGDYETKTPEGDFLCRTYFAKIIKGEPSIIKPKIHRGFDYFNYSKLLKLNDAGILVPNLVLALPKLKDYVD